MVSYMEVMFIVISCRICTVLIRESCLFQVVAADNYTSTHNLSHPFGNRQCYPTEQCGSCCDLNSMCGALLLQLRYGLWTNPQYSLL